MTRHALTPFEFPATARKLAACPGITDPAKFANVGPFLVPARTAPKGGAAQKRAAVNTNAAEALLKRKVQIANDALEYLAAQSDNLDAEIAVIIARKSLLTRRHRRLPLPLDDGANAGSARSLRCV
jgi:hypothetical protein